MEKNILKIRSGNNNTCNNLRVAIYDIFYVCHHCYTKPVEIVAEFQVDC